MRALAVACVAALVYASAAGAQPASGAPSADVFDGVALTPAQAGALRARTANTRTALRSLMAAHGPQDPPTPAARAAARAIVAEHQAAIRALLTDAQRARFDTNVAAADERHRAEFQRRPPRAAATPGSSAARP